MKRALLGLLVSMMSYPGFAADINSISVFVTQAQSKHVVGCNEKYCHIYELDATENTLQSFFGDLSGNEDEAYSMVMEKMNSPQWKAYEHKVIESQKTVINAFELGVTKYPAIVINDTDVSYGNTDVSKAIADFFRSKSNEDY